MERTTRFGLVLASCVFMASCGSLAIQPTTSINAMDTTVGSYKDTDTDRYIIVTMTNAVHEQLVRGERVDREGDLPPMYAKFLGNLTRTYGLKRVADWPLGSIEVRCLIFEVTDVKRRQATIAALAKERFVETAQPFNMFYALADAPLPKGGAYNDPYRDLQPGLQVMQISESHRWATGKGVRVAVIDTGVDTRHPELRDRVVGIRNFVDRNENAFNADVHGTAVAGVIAASSNNGIGLVGIAPEADVVALKACWEGDRLLSGARCSSFTLAKAINFAIDQEVDVINLSLGGPADPLLERLVAKALERNILVVGAASPKWPSGFPAAVDGVIPVTTAGAESMAVVKDGGPIQYIVAPGTQVLSTKPKNDYDFFTGSSFSTANIAGVAALIRQRKPHLSGKVVKNLIATTSQSEPPEANACQALARIVADGACEPKSATKTAQH